MPGTSGVFLPDGPATRFIHFGRCLGLLLARWFAVAVLGLNAIDQMFFIPAYPFWSLTIIAADIVALWGCAPTAAARTSKPPPDAQRAIRGAEAPCAVKPIA